MQVWSRLLVALPLLVLLSACGGGAPEAAASRAADTAGLRLEVRPASARAGETLEIEVIGPNSENYLTGPSIDLYAPGGSDSTAIYRLFTDWDGSKPTVSQLPADLDTPSVGVRLLPHHVIVPHVLPGSYELRSTLVRSGTPAEPEPHEVVLTASLSVIP